MQHHTKICIFTLIFILFSVMVFAETADKKHDSPLKTLEDYNRAILGDRIMLGSTKNAEQLTKNLDSTTTLLQIFPGRFN